MTDNTTTAESAVVPATQAGRMRAAVDKAVAFAPTFLAGNHLEADAMAHTMVGAVHTYVEQERALGSNGEPHDRDAQALYGTLAELMTCGSGYLAGRCDGNCVARTMTQMVHEFGSH